jgi:hypothetical protein
MQTLLHHPEATSIEIHQYRPQLLAAKKVDEAIQDRRRFSECQINIAGEYLRTNAKIGYVVIDVESGEPGESI